MNDEELAEIRLRAARWLSPEVGSLDLRNDILALLAEVESLWKREATLKTLNRAVIETVKEYEAKLTMAMDIVRVVAEGGADRREDEWPEAWVCAFCRGESITTSIRDKAIVHEEKCPVLKARTLLADEGEAQR